MKRIVRTMLIILAALVVVAVVFLRFADRAFHRSFERRAFEIRAAAGFNDNEIITEEDLASLPEPIARYLRFTGVAGKKRMNFVRVLHSGQFKPEVDGPFVPIKGEYYLSTKKPSFCWYGKLFMAPLVSVAAFDSYFDGKSRMLVKLLSAFTVVDDQSKEVAQSSFGRCFTEMLMAPTFFLDRDLLTWEQTGKDSAKCTLADAGSAITAELFVAPDGALERMSVMRYYDQGGLEQYTVRASEYRPQAGFVIATRYAGYWNLKEGDLHYGTFTVDGMEIE